jgi:hypothetical protein
MRRTLVAALFAGLAAMAFATPASALPSTKSVQLGETNAGVIQVGRNDRNWRKRHSGYYPRNYRYHRPYAYRPYAYYGHPYRYPYGYGYGYRRPGISFGFAF